MVLGSSPFRSQGLLLCCSLFGCKENRDNSFCERSLPMLPADVPSNDTASTPNEDLVGVPMAARAAQIEESRLKELYNIAVRGSGDWCNRTKEKITCAVIGDHLLDTKRCQAAHIMKFSSSYAEKP